MSTSLPFDIITQIIDIVGENEDTNLLKELALVSHCFHQICCKHLFATVKLSETDSEPHAPDVPSSKKRFVTLLQSSPDVVKYIRKLTYAVGYRHTTIHLRSDDYLLSPTLPNLLRTIPRLKCLTINALNLEWKVINPALTSAFLHLMHLPTINHIGLSSIRNFPMSSLAPSVNLLRLDISNLSCIDPLEKEIVVRSEMMPKIRELHTSDSPELTSILLQAKRHDGRPAFNFVDLRRLSTSLEVKENLFSTSRAFEDKENLLRLLQNAKLLEKLHLNVGCDQSLEGLHYILSASASTLQALGFTALIYETYADDVFPQPLEGVCEGLEALAGYNMLEALSFEIKVTADYDETEEAIGSLIQNVEKVLAKPGWSALREVSFKVPITCCLVVAELCETLQSLPDRYLSHPSKLESVAFNFSAYIVKCDVYKH